MDSNALVSSIREFSFLSLVRARSYILYSFLAISNIKWSQKYVSWSLVSSIVTTYTQHTHTHSPANSHILQWTDGNTVPGWDLIKFSYWFPFISFYSSFWWCFYHCIRFLFSLQLCPAQLYTYYYYIFSIELHLSFSFIPVSLLFLTFRWFQHVSCPLRMCVCVFTSISNNGTYADAWSGEW